MNPKNAISNFQWTRIWSYDNNRVDISEINSTDLTFGSVSETCTSSFPSTRSVTAIVESANISDIHRDWIENVCQLYKLLLKQSRELTSDGTVIKNDTTKVLTTSGASLTGVRVLDVLCERDKRQFSLREQRAIAQELGGLIIEH